MIDGLFIGLFAFKSNQIVFI